MSPLRDFINPHSFDIRITRDATIVCALVDLVDGRIDWKVLIRLNSLLKPKCSSRLVALTVCTTSWTGQKVSQIKLFKTSQHLLTKQVELSFGITPRQCLLVVSE